MKKLVLVITGAFISIMVFAQAPRNDQNPNTQTNPTQPNIQQNNPYQRPADPTILNPAPLPKSHIQRVDSPAYNRQRGDSLRRDRDINYNRGNRVDSLPRDDRDPNRIRMMNRDSLRK